MTCFDRRPGVLFFIASFVCGEDFIPYSIPLWWLMRPLIIDLTVNILDTLTEITPCYPFCISMDYFDVTSPLGLLTCMLLNPSSVLSHHFTNAPREKHIYIVGFWHPLTCGAEVLQIMLRDLKTSCEA